MSVQFEKNWYIIYVRSRSEKKTFKDLTDLGIQCYLPLKSQVKQWRDRKKKLLLPVFPGYVFIQASPKQMITVYQTRGFIRFVSTNNIPDVISNRRMSNIMNVLDGEFEVLEDHFRTGDSLLIESGPLMGMEGTLIEDRSGSKFVLHLREINKHVVVDSKLTTLKVQHQSMTV